VNVQLKPSEIVIIASGVVALVFSFFNWQDFPGGSWNAWDPDATLPLATYIPIIGVIMAGHIALSRLVGVSFPERVVSFTWGQIHLVLAVFAGLLAIGWLIIAEELAIGFWLTFVATIGLIVGAVMLFVEEQTSPRTAQAPPAPRPEPPQPPPSSSF
jgi:hypothetical protein